MKPNKKCLLAIGFLIFQEDQINFIRKINHMKSNNQLKFFEKQQKWLKWKLERDIVFVIDLTMEVLADKKKHWSKFGIIYLGNKKAQFDLIDDSQETSYNLQKYLQNLKLDDRINIFKALKRAVLTFNLYFE